MLELILIIINAVVVVAVGCMTYRLIYTIRAAAPRSYTSSIAAEADLPSVSVCIPARNEQHALADCLQRVLNSTYERLEILVLDDNSQDDTPALIRSFASEGVRFVKGTPPPKGWLGRTYALEQLLHEASGSYVLYIDIDTVLEPHAIEQLVRAALSRGATMLSVIPRRHDGMRASVIFSPLRYFWELIFHRDSWPATSSSAWLIRRQTLQHDMGGLSDIKNSAQPEAILAHRTALTHQYGALVGSAELGIGYEKKWRSQLLTGVRLLYPALEKQPLIALCAFIDCLLFATPFVVLIVGMFVPLEWWLVVASALASLVSWCMYGIYTKRMWRRGWLLGALLWPVIIIQEACLIVASAVLYHRRAITWKGRPIQPEAQS